MGGIVQDAEAAGYAEQVPSMWKMIETIREDRPSTWWDDIVVRILEDVTQQPGTTVQDALDILEDARKTLLQYQMIC